jgi:AcrR family transcriptional regulator
MDPRVDRTRAAVLRAGAEVIAEGGIQSFSIEAVVARSGVARTTIYRHWPTRRDLLVAIYSSFGTHTATPDEGSLRADLRHLLLGLADQLANADWPRALTSMVSESEHDHDLAEAQRVDSYNEMRPWREVLERARRRGELATDVDIQLIAEHVAGALFFRRLVLHQPTTPDQVDQVLELILGGLTSRTEHP